MDGEEEEERWRNTAGGVMAAIGVTALFVFYVVYMSVHVMAILYAQLWLYSKTSEGVQRSTSDEALPGVSILKPIIGCDSNLRDNLETFFRIDYPKYEILVCISEKGVEVPSYKVVQSLMLQYPYVPIRVFQGNSLVGVNPKINNMIDAYRAAQYSLIWISDNSIETLPYTLTELVSQISPPEVALVHQLPFTSRCSSFADYLDKVYFGTQHSRVYLVASLLGQNCANGMSWLLKKSCLEDVGGLIAFSEYLAEDFFIGKALWLRKWKFVLSTLPALQNPSQRSLTSYQARIIRWGRLRATMMPWPGLVEPFIECFGLGIIGTLSCYYLLSLNPLLFLLVHTFIWFTFDLLLLKIIQHGPLPSLLWLGLAWLLRELWTFPLFLGGVWSREVAWKGARFHVKLGGKAIKLE